MNFVENNVENETGENEVLHHIKVNLFSNYLPQSEGYFAVTDSEASLNVSQICTALIDRAGYNCDHEEIAEHVRKFLDEAVYQLCEGNRINLGFFSVYPSIGGTFASELDTRNPEKNPLIFKYRMEKPLQNLIKHIAVEISGLGRNPAYIKDFIDWDAHSFNTLYTPGNLFTIRGYKIKVAGSEDCGVYFVPVDEPDKAVKVDELTENHSTAIVGVIPEISQKSARIEVRTQYGGSDIFLKTPRIITSKFIVRAAA
jgi:hypothetical protein